MTQKSTKIFMDGIHSKPLKKNYATNKADVHHIDNIWSLDLLDLKGCGRKNNRGNRYVLVVIDNFSQFGWTVCLEKMLKQ